MKQLLSGNGVINLYPGLFYFLQFGALACLHPFLSLMLADRSLTEIQIGVVVAVIPLVKFFGAPLGGYIFDKSGESKIIWIIVILGTAFSIQFIQFTSNLYLITFICGVWSLMQSPIHSIGNHAVLIHLGENKKEYGKYRLWGAVSWGIVSFIIGVIITYLPLSASYISYAIGMFILSIYIFITKFKKVSMNNDQKTISEDEENLLQDEEFETGFKQSDTTTCENNDVIEKETKIESKLEDDGLNKELKSSLSNDDEKITTEKEKISSNLIVILNILLQRDVIVFYIIIFMMSVGITVIYVYLFIYLQNDLGASETLIGVSIVFSVFTEIPFFFYSGKFLDLFGEQWLILSALVAYIIRVIGYSFLQNPWFVLPLELLSGLTFSALFVAAVHYSSNLFPSHLSATGQGIFNGIHYGLGPTCGSLVGGYLYSAYGARFMYRCMAGFVCLATLIHIVNFGGELYTKLKLLLIKIQVKQKSLDVEFNEIELDSLDTKDEKIKDEETPS